MVTCDGMKVDIITTSSKLKIILAEFISNKNVSRLASEASGMNLDTGSALDDVTATMLLPLVSVTDVEDNVINVLS